MKKTELIRNILKRKADCWKMVQTFMDNRDAHGVMDMGAEIQALERAEKEIRKL